MTLLLLSVVEGVLYTTKCMDNADPQSLLPLKSFISIIIFSLDYVVTQSSHLCSLPAVEYCYLLKLDHGHQIVDRQTECTQTLYNMAQNFVTKQHKCACKAFRAPE